MYDCASRTFVNITKWVKRMGDWETDEDDKLSNKQSKPSICTNYSLSLALSAISVWVYSSAFSEGKPQLALIPGCLFSGNGEAPRQELLWLSWYLVMVSVTPLLWPIQPLQVLYWHLTSCLDDEVRAECGTQQVRETAKYCVVLFQKSLLPLKVCIVPAWTRKATQSPSYMNLISKLKKKTSCDTKIKQKQNKTKQK